MTRLAIDRGAPNDRAARPPPSAGASEKVARTVAPGLIGALVGAMVVPDGDPDVRSFFEISPTPQLLLAADRTVRVANQAATRLFAPPGAALAGRPFLELLAPAGRPVVDRLFQALAAPQAAGQRIAAETLPNGGAPISIELLVVRLSSATTSGFGVVARDLRVPAPTRVPTPIEATGSYTLAELLMANRLRELV